jgi:uncharacterized protein (DUF2062 family)
VHAPEHHDIAHPSRALAIRFGRTRWLMRRLPRRRNVHSYPVLRWFAEHAHRRPYLWSFRPTPVRISLWVGTLLAFQPIYGLQIVVAFLAALVLRANLPVMCGLQALTNPLTAGPAYYLGYRLGMVLLGWAGLVGIWNPWAERAVALVLGGLLVGAAVAAVLEGIWRLAVWESKRLRARLAAARARHAPVVRNPVPDHEPAARDPAA